MRNPNYHNLTPASKAQKRLIRYLESEFDPPTRMSAEALHSLSAAQAAWKIGKLYELDKRRKNDRQLTLL